MLAWSCMRHVCVSNGYLENKEKPTYQHHNLRRTSACHIHRAKERHTPCSGWLGCFFPVIMWESSATNMFVCHLKDVDVIQHRVSAFCVWRISPGDRIQTDSRKTSHLATAKALASFLVFNFFSVFTKTSFGTQMPCDENCWGTFFFFIFVTCFSVADRVFMLIFSFMLWNWSLKSNLQWGFANRSSPSKKLQFEIQQSYLLSLTRSCRGWTGWPAPAPPRLSLKSDSPPPAPTV